MCRTHEIFCKIYAPFQTGTVDVNNKISKVIDLSIIIPAYNIRASIEQCVDSILNQISQYEFEFIIVDDEPMDKNGNAVEKV